MQITGFEPIADRTAKVLILGTLPSRRSLEKGEYYAQARNVFWQIMGDLFGIDPRSSYAERTKRLCSVGIALWDVCHSAYRPGSLDASIRNDIPNDFADFLASHRQLRLIGFNGAKAADLYRRKVILPDEVDGIPQERLPSTSPAHAVMPYREKLRRWAIVRERCGSGKKP